MNGACPECGAPLPAAAAGRTIACPRCRNPVLMGEVEARAVPSAPPEPPSAARPRGGASWAMVGVALAVLAVANVGLWLLLTVGARGDAARAEERFAPEEMERALGEGEPEATGDLKADLRRKELGETARAWDVDREHASMVGWALFGAYLLQAGLIVALRVRTAPRRARRA